MPHWGLKRVIELVWKITTCCGLGVEGSLPVSVQEQTLPGSTAKVHRHLPSAAQSCQPLLAMVFRAFRGESRDSGSVDVRCLPWHSERTCSALHTP